MEQTDLKYRKSLSIGDNAANGGRRGWTENVGLVRHGFFPIVKREQRTAGLTRYRKEFLSVESADADAIADLYVWLVAPSNGGDRFAIAEGTQRDTQADIDGADVCWAGCGELNADAAAGDGTVAILMEGADVAIAPGAWLYLNDGFIVNGTIDADVIPMDSVELVAGTWERITPTTDITYPKGIYMGGVADRVRSYQAGTTVSEYIQVAENEYTETIGTGVTGDNQPALTTLAHATNGIFAKTYTNIYPVVTATCGGVTRTVTVNADGSCSGYCTDGELDLTDGTWTTDILWVSAPDNGTDIDITYNENPFSVSGNVYTVTLDGTLANDYDADNAIASVCLAASSVAAAVGSPTITSSAGTYTGTITVQNDGVEEDDYRVTFLSSTSFTCISTITGNLIGSGVISSDFAPLNPTTGVSLFTLPASGWGGAWTTGDRLAFTTHPAAFPIWWRQVVPAGCAHEDNNCVGIGFYCN